MNYDFKNNLFHNNDFELSNNNRSQLISKKIDTYFNDLVKIPEPIQVSGGKSDFTFSKFYDEYIEHNLLLLFIILCLVIFLFIKYINKNYPDTQPEYFNDGNNIYSERDSYNKYNKHNKHNKHKHSKIITNNNTDTKDDTTDTTNTTNTTDTTDTQEATNKNSGLKHLKKKLEKEKYNEILREKEKKKYLLELEKQSILDIIDELSTINYEKIKTNTHILNNNNKQNTNNINYNKKKDYIDSDYVSNDYINNDYINNNYIAGPSESRFSSLNINNDQNFSQYSLINYNDNYDSSPYYNIDKKINYKDKKNPNYIKGMYIESPYDE